jgi:hypothetical protein
MTLFSVRALAPPQIPSRRSLRLTSNASAAQNDRSSEDPVRVYEVRWSE